MSGGASDGRGQGEATQLAHDGGNHLLVPAERERIARAYMYMYIAQYCTAGGLNIQILSRLFENLISENTTPLLER